MKAAASNLFRRLFRRSTLRSPAPWLVEALGGTKTAAGKRVTEATALNYSAVWACTRVISETVGLLSWQVFRELPGGGKEAVRENPAFRVLHDRPNAGMTSFTFRETLTAHTLLWGNGYAEIIRDAGSRVKSLEVLLPDRTTPKIQPDGELVYEIRDPITNETRVLSSQRVLHVRGLGWDGLLGYSVVNRARESIGLGLAAEEFGSTFFGNGAMPGGTLEHPGVLKETARANLRRSLQERHGGAENAHKTMILEEGMKYNTVSVPPDDAQFLETRQFQVPEVCRWFRVPPHKVADLTRATFSNVEQMAIEFVTDTILPWVRRWEQEVNSKLFPNRLLFSEMLMESLLRGDTESRFRAYSIARQWGWMSTNEIRERENLNPLGEEGDVYLVPLNMGNAEKLIEDEEEPQEPAEMPQDEGEDQQPSDILGQLAVANKRLFVDALNRVIIYEVHTLRERIKKGNVSESSLAAWHRKTGALVRKRLIEALTPAAEATAAQCNGGDSKDMFAQIYECLGVYADVHVARSMDDIRNALAVDGWDEMVRDWTQGRAAKYGAQLTESILKLAKEHSHATTDTQ